MTTASRPLAAMALSCVVTAAAAVDDDYAPATFVTPDGRSLPYRIHVPDDIAPGERVPLVLFLHGSGERGDDNVSQLIHGAFDLLDFTRTTGNPAIILAPQCPADDRWVDVEWRNRSHTMARAPTGSMDLVMALIDEVVDTHPVDAAQIYVTGLSMGGFGTWDILQRRPATFAAAIPICGGGDPSLAARIRGVSVWAFHGSDDTVVPLSLTTDMIRALKRAGGKPSYTEYGGVGHDAWTRTYASEDVLQWMFDQERPEPEDGDAGE